MVPKSKYTRPINPHDSLSFLTLDVTVQPKGKIEHSTSSDRVNSSSLDLDDEPRPKTTTRPPRSTTVEAIIEMYGERPLPPIPSTPSSIYISSKRSSAVPNSLSISRESPRTVASSSSSPRTPSPVTPGRRICLNAKGVSSAKHLSQLYRKDIGRKSSIPDTTSEQRKIVREAQPKEAPKPEAIPVKPVPFTEWKAPTYRESSNSSKSSLHTCLSQRSSSFSSTNPSPAKMTADEQAASYFATIHQREPNSFEKGAHNFNLNSNQANSPIPLAAIRNVSKQASVPYPLLTSLPNKIPPRSRFSPSSPSTSDMDSSVGVASSFRTRAKKAFLQTKTSKRPGRKHLSGSKNSDILHALQTAGRPPRMRTAELPVRNGMKQALLEICDNVQSYASANLKSISPQVTRSLKADQLSPPKKKLPTKELSDTTLSLAEYQYHRRKMRKEPKEHPYVYREAKMRLPKPQPYATPTTIAPTKIISMTRATTQNPDTTYKIEMPPPPTQERSTATLPFDCTYHIGLLSPATLSLTRSSSLLPPTRTNTAKPRRVSHSFAGTTSDGNRLPNHLSRTEKNRTGRYSLPLVSPTRQNSNDNTSFKVSTQTSDSSARLKRDRSLERKLLSTTPAPELTRKKMEPATPLAVDLDRERDQGRRKGLREIDGDRSGQTSSDRRREELKKRIVVMGDPSAEGVPF